MVEFTQKKVDVRDLAPGMFVVRLDRPWVETPFPLQGFPIRGEEEIRQIRAYCRHVYIDVVKSRAGTLAAASLATPPAGDATRPAAAFVERPKKYRKTRSLGSELETVRVLHADVSRAIEQVMAKAAAGEPIDATQTRRAARRLTESVIRNPDAALWLARMKDKDSYIYDRAVRSSIWAIAFGRHLGLHKNQLEDLAMGVLLSEVGYTQLPSEILEKTGPLTVDELDTLKQHVEIGVEILQNFSELSESVIAVVHAHHERGDGGGYPRGLTASRIPLLAQIAGIVDVYDAFTTPRPGDTAMTPAMAMAALHRMRDREFPGALIQEFILAIGIYPAGTVVELSTGEVGLVTEQRPDRRLKPRLLLILDAAKRRMKPRREVDLTTLEKERGRSIAILKSLPRGAFGIDLRDYRPLPRGPMALLKRLIGVRPNM